MSGIFRLHYKTRAQTYSLKVEEGQHINSITDYQGASYKHPIHTFFY